MPGPEALTPPLPLQGRVAFVTGAAQGLGLAIARGMAQAGARVVLADERGDVQAQAASLDPAGHGECAWGVNVDVRDEPGLAAAFAEAVRRFGHVDVMVNNAARTSTTSLWDISAQEWDEVLAVNLRGCFLGCRIAARHMRERGLGGRIINMASMAGQQASMATGMHYGASKAGILALTRSLATELAPQAITVNAIAPAVVRSPALDALAPAARDALLRSVPLGRFGEPQEVAQAAIYLASEAGGFITGATLDLNGGRLMR